MLTTILMVLAFGLLLLAAVGVPVPRVSLGWMGMSIWALAIILGGAHLT